MLAYASSFDQVGPLARSVEDVALLLKVIAGHDERDSTCASLPVPDYPAALCDTDSLKGLRLGLPREFTETDALAPCMTAALRKTTDTARDMGVVLVDISLPHTDYAVAAYYIMAMAEAGSNLARYDGVRYGRRASGARDPDELYTRSRTGGFGKEVQRRILLGAYVLSAGYYDAYYRKAAQVRRLIRRDFDRAFERCDALLAPASPVQAWPLGEVSDPVQMYQMDRFTLPLNMAGLPGLAIPVGQENGLPLGLQIIGRSFDEASILRIGHLLTSALGTAGQYAPL
jgi:aspartyl-tRNA(Asn)/glutamyl-tRNA(Gln) amidotransferase subunit A